MTPGGRVEQLTDAMDSILSRSELSAPNAADGVAEDEAVRDEASVLAAALSELRAAYDALDAPFVFDPRTSGRMRPRLMGRAWRMAGVSLAAAAAVTFVVLLPNGSVDTPRQSENPAGFEQASATHEAEPRSTWLPSAQLPGVLDVRTPRLAVMSPEFPAGEDTREGVRSWPRRVGGSRASLARLGAARLSTTTVYGATPASFARSPSMILKPRRKSDDDHKDGVLDGGGSSDRRSVGPDYLG